MNSTTDYPLPAGIGDIIGTIAHISVGLAGMLWGLRCLIRNDAFEEGTRMEKLIYLWSAFWEVVGTIPLMLIPELCYHSLACYQRNVTHVLAGSCMAIGVLWDWALQKLQIPRKDNWGIAIMSSILPAYFLYFHDYDKMEAGDDSELIVHQNAMLMFAMMGLIRLLLPLCPTAAASLRPIYALTSISLGWLMFLAGPSPREELVAEGFSGTNISFGAFLGAGHTFLLGLIIRARILPGYAPVVTEND